MNHYEVLGLTRSATQQDIQSAFIKAAESQDNVDDGTLTSSANARRIQRAYDVLIDPEARKQYERDTFRGRIRTPYRHPGQRPVKSHLWWVMFTMIIIPVAWLFSKFVFLIWGLVRTLAM